MPRYTRAMSTLHIALPGTLWAAEAGAEPYDGLVAPSLARWAHGGGPQFAPETCWSQWLMHGLSGALRDAPFASAEAVNLGLHSAGAWLRADPVHVALGRDDVALTSPATLDLTAEESRALSTAINAHFAQDGYALHVAAPQRWLLSCPRALPLDTTDPWAATDVPQRYVAPTGEGVRALRQWWNEAQMVLHSHPINAEREARGAKPVNSVWPWASGPLSPRRDSVVALLSSCEQARTLAAAMGIPCPDLASLPTSGDVVAYFPELVRALQSGDGTQWREAFNRLERELITPLSERFDRVQLSLGGLRPRLSVHVQRRGAMAEIWRRWRAQHTLIASRLATLAATSLEGQA
jgi:hypothetical protein